MLGLGALLGGGGMLFKIIATKIIVNRVTKLVLAPFVTSNKIMKFIYKKIRRAL